MLRSRQQAALQVADAVAAAGLVVAVEVRVDWCRRMWPCRPVPQRTGPWHTPPTRASQLGVDMGGPQHDFDNNGTFPGQLYEQATGRGIIACSGEVVETREGKPKQLLASLGDAATIKSHYKADDLEIPKRSSPSVT